MTDTLENVIWRALHGDQLRLSQVHGLARRYRAAVAPFASVDENSAEAWDDLRELVPFRDAVFVLGDPPPEASGLRQAASIPLLQMVFPPERPMARKPNTAVIEELTFADASEMMELIAVAFPGYFREETCRMGRYFGIREKGRLVAMGGERMVFETDGTAWRELSALATHPEYTGRGLGTALMQHIIAIQRAMGAVTFLHVIESNTNAIQLYERFGFQTVRRVELHRLVRS